jgi:hypothetical protein
MPILTSCSSFAKLPPNTPSRSGLPGAFRLQAQQRYRAKRKAQFNNMQHTIEELTGKLEAAQVR